MNNNCTCEICDCAEGNCNPCTCKACKGSHPKEYKDGSKLKKYNLSPKEDLAVRGLI